jgi:hypothetical protein
VLPLEHRVTVFSPAAKEALSPVVAGSMILAHQRESAGWGAYFGTHRRPSFEQSSDGLFRYSRDRVPNFDEISRR